MGVLMQINDGQVNDFLETSPATAEFMEMLLTLLDQEELSEQKLKKDVNLLNTAYSFIPLPNAQSDVQQQVKEVFTTVPEGVVPFAEEPLLKKERSDLMRFSSNFDQEIKERSFAEAFLKSDLLPPEIELQESFSSKPFANLIKKEFPEIRFTELINQNKIELDASFVKQVIDFETEMILDESTSPPEVAATLVPEVMCEKIELTPANVVKDLPEVVFKELKTLIQVNGEKEIVIHLKPKELGKLVVELTVDEGKVSVKFVAEQPLVRNFLENNLDTLKQSFLEHEIPFAGLNVALGGEQLKQSRSQQELIWDQSSQKNWTRENNKLEVETESQTLNLQLSTYDYLV